MRCNLLTAGSNFATVAARRRFRALGAATIILGCAAIAAPLAPRPASADDVSAMRSTIDDTGVDQASADQASADPASANPAAPASIIAQTNQAPESGKPAGYSRQIDQHDLELLADPDTSSPRATLTSLHESVKKAYELLIEAYHTHRSAPGFGVRSDVAEKVTEASLHLRRAESTLDLDKVPQANRRKTALVTVLLLKEILDRLPELPEEKIPGPNEIARAKPPIASWTMPYSEIHIVRMTEGPRTGEYLFSGGTVLRAQPFYEIIKQFSERSGAPQDFFEFYTLTPGNLLPPKWYLWIEDLPDWTRASVLGQAVWQWIGVLMVLLVLGAAYVAVWRLPKRKAEEVSQSTRTTFRLFMTVLLVLVAFTARWLIIDQLNISGWAYVVTNSALYAILYLAAAWASYFAFIIVAEWIISSPRIDPSGIDASMLRITARVIGITSAIGIIFYGATQIGISLYGVIAGLGVGGLALGLAARPTLENLIGGVILYADRPVRVGDFCQFGNTFGTVEEIGLRSTKIRARDRTLITIPNAEFSNMQLVNWSRRDQSMLKTTISLRYETTPEQIRQVLGKIRQLLLDTAEVDPDQIRVRFRELGEYALGVEVYAFVDTTSNSHFLEVQEELFLAIMDIVAACGSALALPSTTTYHVMNDATGPKYLSAKADEMRAQIDAAAPTGASSSDRVA